MNYKVKPKESETTNKISIAELIQAENKQKSMLQTSSFNTKSIVDMFTGDPKKDVYDKRIERKTHQFIEAKKAAMIANFDSRKSVKEYQ